nr:uncharacterized protein LOC123760077 [Procambarus clarkii]
MAGRVKDDVAEQLAVYRWRKKQQEEEERRRGLMQRVWEFLPSLVSRATPPLSSPTLHQPPRVTSEDTHHLNTSKEIRRRPQQSVEVTSSNNTDFNDEDLQTSSLMFYANYSTLDWVALALKWLMWLLLFKVFILLEFGAVYFIFSAFIFIWFTMRSEPKKEGEISAYSVFNPNCEAIDGTYSAEQFERELLHKM